MIGSIFSTARGALMAHQVAAQITAHNVSNASTEGYSRQRVLLTPGMPLRMPYGMIGTGVRVADINRIRDSLLDSSFRREHSATEGARLRSDLLGRLESVVGEPGDQGLAATLDAFWSSWGDLANDPSNSTARHLVRERGRLVAEHLHRLNTGIDDMAGTARATLQQGVGELNSLAQRVATLNMEIISAEAGGRGAPDLRDERDRHIDAMSRLVGITVNERANGSVAVVASGITLVDDGEARSVQLNGVALTTATGRTIEPGAGRLGEAITLLSRSVPVLRHGLDQLARGIVQSVNAVHRAGTGPAGATGIAFFDEFGGIDNVTAANIALSADVEDARNIAAGTAAPDGSFRSGANDIALALAQLRHSGASAELDGLTISEFYSGWVGGLAISVSAARQTADAHEVLQTQAELRRASISGVSTDEELVSLIQHQAAYAAAAKLIAAADEMLQTLINIV